MFDWSILKEAGGGLILSRQEFSWEFEYLDTVYSGSKGPMYFVDLFDADSNGELVLMPAGYNGVRAAEPHFTGYGMHMSLLNAEVSCMLQQEDYNDFYSEPSEL